MFAFGSEEIISGFPELSFKGSEEAGLQVSRLNLEVTVL